GERQVEARGERDDRRAEARRADYRVEHEIGLRAQDQLPDPVLPRQHLSAPGPIRALGGVGVGEGDGGYAMLARLLEQQLPVRVRREARDLQALTGGDHLECLGADRTRRSEYQ